MINKLTTKFDEICHCDYEYEDDGVTIYCVCTKKKKDTAKVKCQSCMDGNHTTKAKTSKNWGKWK